MTKIIRKLEKLALAYQSAFHALSLAADELYFECDSILSDPQNGKFRVKSSFAEFKQIEELEDDAMTRTEILDYGNTDVDPDILFERINKLKSLVQKRLKKAAKSKRKS
jgi:tRNA nucleotidyltransferase (CCA-adding enzyme)